MAFLLWFHVATEREFTIDVDYDISYEGIREGLILAQPPPQETTITCRGSGKNLLPLIFSERNWVIDLSAFDAGLVEIELDSRNAPTYDATGVEIVGTAGSPTLQLRLDRKIDKTVPVSATFIYEPRDGYLRVGYEVLQPDSVALTGPESTLEGIDEVLTRPRTFSNIARPIDTEIELDPITAYNVSSNTETCQLQADVQSYEERVFPAIPIADAATPATTVRTLHPPVISIIVGGAHDLLESLRVDQISVEIDSSNIDSFPALCGVTVQIPPGFRLVRSDPDSVLVSIPE